MFIKGNMGNQSSSRSSSQPSSNVAATTTSSRRRGLNPENMVPGKEYIIHRWYSQNDIRQLFVRYDKNNNKIYFRMMVPNTNHYVDIGSEYPPHPSPKFYEEFYEVDDPNIPEKRPVIRHLIPPDATPLPAEEAAPYAEAPQGPRGGKRRKTRKTKKNKRKTRKH